MISSSANQSRTIPLLLISVLFVSGCAATYHPVNVNEFTFNAPVKVGNSLSVVYLSGVQKLTQNRSYELSETKKKMRTVALRIQNITDTSLKITTNNFKIHSPGGDKRIIYPETYAAKVHQNQKGYLTVGAMGAIAGLAMPVENKLQTMTPAVVMAASLGWGLANFSRVLNANRASKATLDYYEIWGREIAPGQTIDGIVIIPSGEENQLTFSYHPDADETPRVLTYDSLTLRKMNQLRPQVDFVVVPTTGTSYTVHTAIQTTGTRDYIIKGDGSRINPEDTKSIVWTRHEKRHTGIPHEGRWIFKVMSGKINAYSFEVENKSVIDYLQMGTGEIVPYKPRTLAAMVNDDPEIVTLVKKGKAVEALKKINSSTPVAPEFKSNPVAIQKANQLSPQLDYLIVPLSGTTYNLRASIKTTGSRDYMEKKDGTKLNPEDTKTIVFVKDGERVTGVPYEGRWIYKVISGKINAYAYEYERKPEIEFIQTGNGEIVRYTPEKLAEMAGQDAEVVGLLQAGKVVEAVRNYNERVGSKR